MKKFVSLTLSVLMVLSLMTGCGGSSMAADSAPAMKNEFAVESPAAPVPEAGPMVDIEYMTGGAKNQHSETNTDQKLIKTVRMDVETEDLEALLPQVNERIAALGGYIENQELYNGSSYSSYRNRSANLTVRVPAQNLNGFVEDVKGVSNVVTYNESTENVTLQYVSTESRVKALETEQTRLLELLENAETMEDLLTIEKRLTEVRWELENYASQLRVLDNQVNYSTIHLNVWEVDEPTVIVERTVWQKIGDGFSENAGDMWDGLVNFFIWAITIIPYLIPLALIAGVVLLVLKLTVFRKKKVDKTPKTTEEK